MLNSLETGKNAAQMATSYHEEFVPIALHSRIDRNGSRWMPPPDNVYKVNADAALSIENNIMGIGIVVRHSEGMFMAGKLVQLVGCPEPYRAELIATWEALLFA